MFNALMVHKSVFVSLETPSCCSLTDRRRTSCGAMSWRNLLLRMKGSVCQCSAVGKDYVSSHICTLCIVLSSDINCLTVDGKKRRLTEKCRHTSSPIIKRVKHACSCGGIRLRLVYWSCCIKPTSTQTHNLLCLTPLCLTQCVCLCDVMQVPGGLRSL